MSDQPIRISRYLLTDRIRVVDNDLQVSFWRGHDEVLDREVSVRLIDADDPRAAAVLGAARAAALVDDRRLVRILDVLDVAATTEHPGRIAVVSEWVRGRSLERVMRDRDWQPVPLRQALAIVDDVALAVGAGEANNVSHGRLRAASVILTDADEVRVRGLAVDAAIWGTLVPGLTRPQADVDGLGSLLMLLLTGTWPGGDGNLPPTPRAHDRPLPPSQVTANIPRAIDDCVARSLADAERPRGALRISDAAGFAASINAIRAQLDAPPSVAVPPTRGRRAGRTVLRLGGAILALAIAVAIGALGWQMITTGPSAWTQRTSDETAEMLTASATPSPSADGIEQVRPVLFVQSFDPLGDDNGNGKPDGRKGRENDDQAVYAIDGIANTAWTSDRYDSADLDGKAGTGLVLDLGESTSVRSVKLDFDGAGTATEVRVADKLYKVPGTWNLLASAPAGGDEITLRGPRPLVGRYVLLWFPQAPQLADRPGRYQIALNDVVVTG